MTEVFLFAWFLFKKQGLSLVKTNLKAGFKKKISRVTGLDYVKHYIKSEHEQTVIM
jgi:hypothetical protein